MTNPPDYEDPQEHWPVLRSRTPESSFVDVDRGDPDFPASLGTFEATVWDGNVDEDLRYRWFVDYDPARPGWPYYCRRVDEQTLRPTGIEERLVSSPIGLWYSELSAGSCHRLTLVVTDGPFDPEGCAVPSEGAHRAVNDWWLLVFDESAGVSREEVRAAHCATRAVPLGT